MYQFGTRMKIMDIQQVPYHEMMYLVFNKKLHMYNLFWKVSCCELCIYIMTCL
jgi:hypothetical protein